MQAESLELISEYCQNVFFRSPHSDKLLVFLPSVNGKDIYPYFPRRSWAEDLVKKYNVLYVSDPYQPLPQYEGSMGSWFVSPDGLLTLNFLSERIELLAKEIKANDIVFYGSSMGGYAALILASLYSGSKAVAECPQLYLKKHPGSRLVCESILSKEICVSDIEPLSFLRNGVPKHIRVICSVFDRHYSQHVLPFFNDLGLADDLAGLNITLQAYINHGYKKGHVAMNKEDAVRVIDEVFYL